MTIEAILKQEKKLIDHFGLEKISFNNIQKDVNMKLELRIKLKSKEIKQYD
jgi:hypothetical protein